MSEVRIKVTGQREGKHAALLVPAIIDSDGEVTISAIAAAGASMLLRSALWPESIKTMSFPTHRRRHKRKVV